MANGGGWWLGRAWDRDRRLPTARRNIEIKARVRDLPGLRAAALALGARPLAHERQTDTYFRVPAGRLKLREKVGEPATLIGYHRPDAATSRLSRYHLVPIPDAVGLKALLESVLGVRAVVKKEREILLYRAVRIHLDRVDGLGTFLELEAVLAPDHDEAEGQELVRWLTEGLGIAPEELMGASYVDLLERGSE